MSLNVEFLAFLVLSLMAIGGAIFMLNMTRVIHMALALAFTFFSIAGLYLLLNAAFLAVVQILIYTGAITILMLFGIMLTKHHDEERSSISNKHTTLSFIAVAVFVGICLWVIYGSQNLFTKTADLRTFDVEKLGAVVFTHYVIPFELSSILLLVALVGAIILAKKEEK